MRPNKIPAFAWIVLVVSLLSLPLVAVAQQPEPTPQPAPEQAPPPPADDAVAESRTTDDGDSSVTTWYANPAWIAIGAVAVVAVALLIAFAARNPERTNERTTVVKT